MTAEGSAASRVDVVVPVRNARDLVVGCLQTLIPEAAANDGRVIVVDDASDDETPEIAERLGAEVRRLDRPSGPYAARNVGWRHGSAPVVAFTDVRCRARPGWLAGLLDALDQGVAVAGGDTWAMSGTGLSERFAHRRQLLLAEDLLADEYLPYLPTCNLITTRDVLECLDGFAEVRSGGDVDLCWRAQFEGLGEVVYAPRAAMDWVPRTTVRAVLSQWSRYGRSRIETVARFADHGLTPKPPPSRRALGRVAAGRLRAAFRDDRENLAVEIVERLAWLAYWRTYRLTYRAWADRTGRTS